MMHTSPTTNITNGYHSVRLIGWGELNSANVTVPYWIAVNSWGYEWGEKGTFRVIRGVNAMNIETWASAGAPLVDDALLRRYS
ncbi:tubulointerstitial nephritis antigen [Aphelenchoides avenae]|nr:tubulointerstitial nephritis antigen [Aphelenchus avenae]